MTRMANTLTEGTTPAMRAAQDAIELRQKALEAAVQRQATLEGNASLRERQEASSAVSEAHKQWMDAQESVRLAEESDKAMRRQQMEIDDTQQLP